MTAQRLGFIGLGKMGGPMAGNLAAAGFDLVVHDLVEAEARAPAGAAVAASAAAVAARAETVMLSLPDGAASLAVAREIVAAPDCVTSTIIDFSTTGLEAAENANTLLNEAGIAFVDAPVSGGQAGARGGTLTIIWAGPAALLDDHRDAMQAVGGNIFHVGDRPGQGQAMKLLNNYLSAVAMAATSEAIEFGLSRGLDMATMLDVVNVSTGRNEATRDKFPKRILTGSYDAGFDMALMRKDLDLFIASVRSAGTAREVGEPVVALWQRADAAMPKADFTHIFEFVRGLSMKSAGAD